MRTVIWEHTVSSAIDSATVQYARFDQWWDALEWIVSHKPENGVPVSNGYFVYRQKRAKSGDPDLVILYQYDDSSVTIYGLRIVPSPGVPK